MIRNLKVFKSLNIEANEVTPVLLFIAQSVFIGIFYGAFDIGAHTLFLKTYPEDMIPKAYIISGIIGILLTSVFSQLQSKIQFSKLANRTFLFISLITILIRVFFEITQANWTVFVVFILLGPLNILAILSFWGTIGRIFNLRQGKRLFGIIDSGQVFGIIISSYAIPLIIDYMHGTKNLLVICAISVIIAMIIEMLIVRKYKIDVTSDNEDTKEEDAGEREQVKIKDFAKDPYILYMALFVIFSMFAAFFVQYSFLVVTNEKYPVEDDLAKYLGFFTGSMMIFTFIIKTFVYSKLMKTYGLKISLLLSSLLLALFTGIAIVIGYVSGFDKAAPGFIYFFLFISMGKLFNKTLKDALEVPAFKLLYQSLRKAIRFDVQAKIDGTINEISALTSGILLSVLGALAFIKLIHFSVFLFALLIIWSLITFKLYREYRNSLERALKQDIEDSEEDEEKNPLLRSFEHLLNQKEKFIIKLDHLRNYLPLKYIDTLKALIYKYPPDKLDFLNFQHLSEILLLNIAGNNNMPDSWKNYIENEFKHKPIENASIKDIGILFSSGNLNKINSAFQYLSSKSTKENLTLLGGLLRYPNIEVQNLSIRISGSLHEYELINTLVEFIDSKYLFSSALISLLQLGKSSVKNLIQMFYKSDISLNTQLALISLIGKYKSKESINFLLENITHHRKDIRSIVITCLKELDFQPGEPELPKMYHSITEASQNVAWDVSALASLDSSYDDHPLEKALHYEFLQHQKDLIDLLYLTFDSTSVQHVQDYLNSETTESISYALELFDLFLAEEIKPMILAVFEDMPLDDKTRLFENFFPVEIMSVQELLLNIINRDPNLISKETKKAALIEYTNLFKEVTNDLVAQLFNPVVELQITAAVVVNQLQPEKINQVKPRMEQDIQKNLEKVNNYKEISGTLFQIDDLIKKEFSIDSHEFADLSEYLSFRKEPEPHFFNINNYLTNYFVFLIPNQAGGAQTNMNKIYIDKINQNENNIPTEIEFFVGIEKQLMEKLVLTNPKVVQNLLNTIE